jgi:hypothetical protein
MLHTKSTFKLDNRASIGLFLIYVAVVSVFFLAAFMWG